MLLFRTTQAFNLVALSSRPVPVSDCGFAFIRPLQSQRHFPVVWHPFCKQGLYAVQRDCGRHTDHAVYGPRHPSEACRGLGGCHNKIHHFPGHSDPHFPHKSEQPDWHCLGHVQLRGDEPPSDLADFNRSYAVCVAGNHVQPSEWVGNGWGSAAPDCYLHLRLPGFRICVCWWLVPR